MFLKYFVFKYLEIFSCWLGDCYALSQAIGYLLNFLDW